MSDDAFDAFKYAIYTQFAPSEGFAKMYEDLIKEDRTAKKDSDVMVTLTDKDGKFIKMYKMKEQGENKKSEDISSIKDDRIVPYNQTKS